MGLSMDKLLIIDALANNANASVTPFGGVNDTSTDVAIRAKCP